MTNYIYNHRGQPVGFWRGRFVYDMRGEPVGQLLDTHVHKLSGQYVGELHEDVIVNKHLGNLGNIGHPGHPGNVGSPGHPGTGVCAVLPDRTCRTNSSGRQISHIVRRRSP